MKKSISLLFLLLLAAAGFGQTATDSIDHEIEQATSGTVRVKIETRLGDIEVRLYDATPVHRDNFLRLVKEQFYDNRLFHRVIKGFMIQGGDPQLSASCSEPSALSPELDYTLEPEFRPALCHKRGALAAAREGDRENPGRRSSSTQFYIVWGRTYSPRQMEYLVEKSRADHPEGGALTDVQQRVYALYGGTPHLDGAYTVFGEVEQGLDVVEKIQNEATNPADRPLQDVVMRITLVEQ